MPFTPTNINDIVYHSAAEKQLVLDIATGVIPFPVAGKNGILLYGSFGSGKTTLAKLLPEAIENSKGGSDVLFDFYPCQQGQNGATLIEKIENRSITASFNYSGIHYFVLDEVDNLTTGAMASLKSVMNRQSCIFIMTTNVFNMIDSGVCNRSWCINFFAAPPEEWLTYSQKLLSNLGVSVEDEKLLPVIDKCNGSAREITSALHRIAVSRRRIQSSSP